MADVARHAIGRGDAVAGRGTRHSGHRLKVRNLSRVDAQRPRNRAERQCLRDSPGESAKRNADGNGPAIVSEM